MKRVLEFLAVALLALASSSSDAFVLGGAQTPASTPCGSVPPGSPSPNGSCLLAPNVAARGLTDINGNVWNFSGSSAPWLTDGVANISGDFAGQLQVNSGGHLFLQVFSLAPSPQPWSEWDQAGHINNSDQLPAVSPTAAAIGNVFQNTTTSVTYPTIQRMVSALANNQTIHIPKQPSPMAAWPSSQTPNVLASGVTINCDAGAAIWTMAAQAKLQGDNETVNGCDFSYSISGGSSADDSLRVFANTLNPVLKNTRHTNSDMGIHGGGDQLTFTITNPYIQHNGGSGGNGPGSCDSRGFFHGIYLFYMAGAAGVPSPDRTVVTMVADTFTGNGQAIFLDQTCQGDPIKFRSSAGTVSGGIIGDSGQYSSDPNLGPNWPASFPCGGTWTYSNYSVVRSPNTASRGGNYGLIDYASEIPGSVGDNWNCYPKITFTATLASGSPTMTAVNGPFTDPAGDSGLTIAEIVVGARMSCAADLPTGNSNLLRVTAVGANTITLSGNATGSGTAVSCTTVRNNTFDVGPINAIDDGDSDASHLSYLLHCPGDNCTAQGSVVTLHGRIVIKAAAFPGCTGNDLPAGVNVGSATVVCYPTRALAAAGEGWFGLTDPQGNQCTIGNGCAAPFIPPHP